MDPLTLLALGAFFYLFSKQNEERNASKVTPLHPLDLHTPTKTPQAATIKLKPGQAALKHGQAYHATITLPGIEAMASNETVARVLNEKSGPWSKLTVTGSGGIRYAHGTFMGGDRIVTLPKEVTHLALG